MKIKIIKLILKYVLGVFFALAGLNHFINPVFYLKIMPPYLPWHAFLVYLSGFFEVVFGILVLLPEYTRIGAWGIIAVLIAVTPANLHMAQHPQFYADIPPWALWLRLPLQLVLIAWAYWYTDKHAS
ncbi:MAG TPA: DoxX family membrane protein [Pyrinomonadaceae bacterium]|nr:DoxX family membrane protein [Pyrinomonadaceae bacterium]